MACGDVLSLEDLQTAKKHQIFEAEVITGKAGGVAGGADIDYATNHATGQTQKTLPATLRDAGFFPASFDFTTGGTLTVNDRNKVVYDPVSQTWYSWAGALPKVIPAATNPLLDANWKPQTDPKLRADLANSTDVTKGDALIAVKLPYTGAVAQTQHDFNKAYVNAISFGADPSGETDSTSAIQAAIDAVYNRGGGEVFIPATAGNGAGNNAGYKISASLQLKPFVNLRGEGFSSCLRATAALTDGVIQLINHGSIGGRYIRNIRLIGNGDGVGIGTNITAADTTPKYIYGWTFDGVLCETFATGLQLQGLWHSTLSNVTTSACPIGLDLWGQNVSNTISGCHFRRDGAPVGGSRGINIHRRVYAWSTDQANGTPSEAIVINGETMCIGMEYGIYVDGGLDFHFSNLDLDFCGLGGIRVLEVNGTFSVTDSWIAADAAGTGAFIGIAFLDGAYLGSYVKKLSGLQMSATNASSGGGNINIQAGTGTKYMQISDSTFGGGNVSVFLSGTSASSIRGCKLERPLLYRNGCQNITVCDSELAGIDETGKPAGTFNYYRSNTGTPGTNGFMSITVPGNGTTATGTIPNGSASMFYVVTKLDRDPSASADRLSVSGSTVTVNRATPVALPVGCYLEYKAT